MRILLVEPWFGGSHRSWAEGYQRHSGHDVELLTLPDENWRWRLRGAALTLAERVESVPDVVLASSLLDVAQFLGHARRRLADVPVALFMHENQLTYPLPPGAKRDTDAAFTNWTSMAAADRVIFNSEFHRSAWFEALPGLLGSMPEPRHLDQMEAVGSKSTVLPIGVEIGWIAAAPPIEPGPPLIVWNHRWEHDKRPDIFASAIRQLIEEGFLFRLAILGEAPSGIPEAFEGLEDLLGERLLHFGFADRARYEQILANADVVVSTADHEFFGVAVVEAMAAGAAPVLPDKLGYPELIPAECAQDVFWSEPEQLVAQIKSACSRGHESRIIADHMLQFSWTEVAQQYDAALTELRTKLRQL